MLGQQEGDYALSLKMGVVGSAGLAAAVVVDWADAEKACRVVKRRTLRARDTCIAHLLLWVLGFEVETNDVGEVVECGLDNSNSASAVRES